MEVKGTWENGARRVVVMYLENPKQPSGDFILVASDGRCGTIKVLKSQFSSMVPLLTYILIE